MRVWLRNARFDVVELIGHETGAPASRHIDDVNRKPAAQKIVRPTFPAIRGSEKVRADQSAARHHDQRHSIFTVAQLGGNEIFDVGLAGEHLGLVVRNIFQIAGALRTGLRAVDDLAAGPKDAVEFERERRALLIHGRIGTGARLGGNENCREQHSDRDHARAQFHEPSQ